MADRVQVRPSTVEMATGSRRSGSDNSGALGWRAFLVFQRVKLRAQPSLGGCLPSQRWRGGTGQRLPACSPESPECAPRGLVVQDLSADSHRGRC